MHKKIVFFYFFLSTLITSKLYSSENFYNLDYGKDNLTAIQKVWTYKSGYFADSQTKPISYDDKIIHLDGHKNLHIISIETGKLICKNIGKIIDGSPYRGLSLYNKSKNEVYAVFPRNNNIILVNIHDCKQKILRNKIVQNKLYAKILINNNIAILLPNGSIPKAYNLDTGNLLWSANISTQDKKKLIKFNRSKKFYWDVWGGGVIDKDLNQIIFSTANAKPAYDSRGREGPNLFYNSIVSLNLKTGEYNWHFQEIEHDVLNLDLATPPVLFNKSNKHFLIQATKYGQLIILDRKNGKPTENYVEKIFFHDEKKKNFTKIKSFNTWQKFSKNNFNKNDFNNLNEDYENLSKKIIQKSLIKDYSSLKENINYIHYGFHGGSEWPGVGITSSGLVIIPANNIAWVSKLENKKFIKNVQTLYKLIISSFTTDKNKIEKNFIKIKIAIKKIFNLMPNNIEKYQRFETSNGIPLNAPPWGTITAINFLEKKKMWSVPHGHYPQLDNKYKFTGSEVFGCPVIASNEVFFLSGTRDKHIYAYSVKNGKELWKDKLEYIAYGCPIIAKYKNSAFIIINSSGGSKFENTKKGDAVIAYKLM